MGKGENRRERGRMRAGGRSGEKKSSERNPNKAEGMGHSLCRYFGELSVPLWGVAVLPLGSSPGDEAGARERQLCCNCLSNIYSINCERATPQRGPSREQSECCNLLKA